MLTAKLDGFAALTKNGLHVVRARAVDSPEDAMAFAARRDAADDRAVPILLAAGDHREGPLRNHGEIRRAFRRLHDAVPGSPVIAHVAVEPGTDLTIECRIDEERGKVIALRCGEHIAERMIPLGTGGATYLAEHFLAHDHAPRDERTSRMLEHLLERVSTFFADKRIERAIIGPVRLHGRTYTILDAAVFAAGPLHVPKRKGPHARDRKAYDYRPAGRQ